MMTMKRSCFLLTNPGDALGQIFPDVSNVRYKVKDHADMHRSEPLTSGMS